MFMKLAAAATIAIAASGAMADEIPINMLCSSIDSMATMLEQEKEAPVFTGDAVIHATNGTQVAGSLVFTMNQNNAFTIIFSPADEQKMVCVLTSGQNVKAVNQ